MTFSIIIAYIVFGASSFVVASALWGLIDNLFESSRRAKMVSALSGPDYRWGRIFTIFAVWFATGTYLFG